MNLKLSNYNKPSHKTYRLIGDIALFAIPIYIPIIMSLPISDLIKSWIVASLSFISGTIKIISKFTLDENYVDNNIQQSNTSNKELAK
jgi:hypothetical protein